jgi:hypothetical protein
VEKDKVQFTLRGFRQVLGFRVYAFEARAEDQSRIPFTVKADLDLARRYGIRLQELPLLCREILDTCPKDAPQRAFAFTEEAMRLFAAARDETAKPRKPPRRPASDQVGAAWRGTQR